MTSQTHRGRAFLKAFVVLGLLALAALLTGPAPLAHAATFTVNSTGNGADSDPGDGVCETASGNGVCTLRAAIQEANHANNPGLDTIEFNIGGGGYRPSLIRRRGRLW